MVVEAWIARDKDGTLEIYTGYPQRNMKDEMWVEPMLLDSESKKAFLMDINCEDQFAKHVEITINELPQ